ncbi:MAG: iron-containing alcohol dehydrogenase [Actinomycetota bacterium]|nr:iron-containing alcohol dehydrogenase [Actinomycetota bacterium]
MPEFPEVVVFDGDDETDAASDLARRLATLDISAPFVISGSAGRVLGSALGDLRPEAVSVSKTDQAWADDAGAAARAAGADAIVAIGGGRCLDVAKLASARAGLVNVAVPTQLSHDGICSPVAVVPNEAGESESLGAVEPRFVYLSMPTLLHAPIGSVRAGIGDLLANPLALKDWALAVERGLDEMDQRAWDMSVESFELIQGDLDRDPADSVSDIEFHRRLADALILSGMAMVIAGTSRPASGGEHEISHAIDSVFGGRAMHGAQVAFGCIFSVALWGEDAGAFRTRLRRLGLPDDPAKLGLSPDDVGAILLAAPQTRPGRFTIIEESNLDTSSARALVTQIWS